MASVSETRISKDAPPCLTKTPRQNKSANNAGVSLCGLYSLITGSLCISIHTKVAKPPTASLISLCRKVKRPPFLHANASRRVNGD